MRRGWRPLAGALVAAATLAAPLRAQAAGVYTGLGFDTCVAPPLTTLTAWLASPYRAVGVYIGGVNQGCPAGTPTPSWIAGASAGGWSLVPLYVGPQAPCVTRKGLATIDAATAGPQGAEAADDAAARASGLGLAPDSPIYFDMEGYATNDAGCTAVVQAFLAAWVSELHARGFVAGVYGSAASTIRDVAATAIGSPATSPDAVWIANWNGQASVFGDPYVPDGLWANHQRLHQFSGGHAETYGGVTLTIDSSYLDGPVVPAAAAPPGPPPPPPPPPAPPPESPPGTAATPDGRVFASWPAGTFSGEASLALTTATPTTVPPGFAAEYAVQLAFAGVAAAPVAIRIAPPTAGLVLFASADGSSWSPLATTAYTLQPDGSLVVTTTSSGFVGLFRDVAPPAVPAGVSGRFARGALVVSWRAASDNSGVVGSYRVLLDGRPLVSRPGSATQTSVRSFHPNAPTVFRVAAVDPAGNASAPSSPVVVVPSAKPRGLPRPLPSWAWRLLEWQQHRRAESRPATPRPLPAWYWRWAAWRLQPFRVRR